MAALSVCIPSAAEGFDDREPQEPAKQVTANNRPAKRSLFIGKVFLKSGAKLTETAEYRNLRV